MQNQTPIKHRRDLWQVINVPGNAAEIGVAEGLFSAEILSWSINFPTVYLVDRWLQAPNQKGDASNSNHWHTKNLTQCAARVMKYGDRPVFLRGDSALMATYVPNASLAFVYVDADHSREGVLRDIFAWVPKLVKGGIMAFHDYENPSYGVKQAVYEYTYPRRHLQIIKLPEDKLEDAGAYFVV